MVATFKLKRSRVATKITAGNALNCSGLSMNSPIKNTPIEIAKLTAKSTSIRKPGKGNTIISTMPMIAVGIASSAMKLCCEPAVVLGVGADATVPRFARNMPAKTAHFPRKLGRFYGDSQSSLSPALTL